MRAFNEDLVRVDLEHPEAENNYRLVHGTAVVTAEEAPTDFLFHVRIRNAIKILRTVEVYEMKEFKSSQESAT